MDVNERILNVQLQDEDMAWIIIKYTKYDTEYVFSKIISYSSYKNPRYYERLGKLLTLVDHFDNKKLIPFLNNIKEHEHNHAITYIDDLTFEYRATLQDNDAKADHLEKEAYIFKN